MEFVRKKKRGQNAKVRRTWLSEERYCITWRREVFGIAVAARYQATVLEVIPNFSGVEGEWYKCWGFVSKQRLFKTLKTATEACEQHYRLWVKACEASGIRALRELFGNLPIAVPVWVKSKLNRKTYAVLTEVRLGQLEEDECAANPDGLLGISAISLHDTKPSSVTRSNGPALTVEAADGSTIPMIHHAQSKATASAARSDVQPAMEAEEGPAKPARKRTAKPSKGSRRKSVTTKGSSKRAKKPASGSRKNKSKPSGN